jgi:hypothetical protein
MFYCFSVTAPTGVMYIGYDRTEDIRAAFRKQSHKNDPSRGSVQLLAEAGGDESLLIFQLLSVHETEFAAYLARNTQRAQERTSITPPCAYPPSAHKAAKQLDPALVNQWQLAAKIHACKTARHAYTKYISPTYNQIVRAVQHHTKPVVDAALDTLTPLQFHLQIIATTPDDHSS